ELEGLPDAEVWRVRVYAGLRRVVHDVRAQGPALLELLNQDSSPAARVLELLGAPSLAALGATARAWRGMPSWSDLWFIAGKEDDFGKQRRLVPSGRFERFDEVMLEEGVDWPERYRSFRWAAHCPDLESLRLAAVKIARSFDLESNGLEEVRRRLSSELRTRSGTSGSSRSTRSSSCWRTRRPCAPQGAHERPPLRARALAHAGVPSAGLSSGAASGGDSAMR
ncbi:unnamed protein product, partial [Prorocentrum cordatum]